MNFKRVRSYRSLYGHPVLEQSFPNSITSTVFYRKHHAGASEQEPLNTPFQDLQEALTK